MKIDELLNTAVKNNATDVFLIPGMPFSYKLAGLIKAEDNQTHRPEDIDDMITQIYTLAKRDMDYVMKSGDDDFSFAMPGVSRFRASVYKQRGSLAAVIRVVSFDIPKPAELHIPDEVMSTANYSKGLVLVTGSAGSGKTTTLACIIDKINSTRNGHIITLEDPIEYMHKHKKSIVTQREIYTDTDNYAKGLRAALRQAPDVLLVGEMRDYETIRTALTAAETGHLVISTLHTIGAVNSIDRMIDSFPAEQQSQIKTQISMTLEMVVSQQLVPSVTGELIPVFEIMKISSAIRNLIRESKIYLIPNTAKNEDLITMDAALKDLYSKGIISADVAIDYAQNRDVMIGQIKK